MPKLSNLQLYEINRLKELKFELSMYIPESAIDKIFIYNSKLISGHNNFEIIIPKNKTFPCGIYVHITNVESGMIAKIKALEIMLKRFQDAAGSYYGFYDTKFIDDGEIKLDI